MADEKKPAEGVTVRIPIALADDLDTEVSRHPRGNRPSRGELLHRAWVAQKSHPAAPHSGEPHLIRNSIPAKDPEKALGELPEEVLSFVLRHWNNEDFRQALLALGRVWDVGDEQITDALTRNCLTFARSSDMAEELRNRGTDPEQHGESANERRTKALLRDQSDFEQATLQDEEVAGNAAGSREGVPGVGSRPVRAPRGKQVGGG